MPPARIPAREDYLRQWSALHGGVRPTGLVGGWLRVVHAVGAPLVRLGAGPDAVTLGGVLVALAAVGAASAGGSWPVLAAVLVGLSGLFDGLDGAVALLSGRASARGFVLDSVCDRVSDAACVAALWVAGAPPAVAVAGGAIAWLHEYVRARAAVAGMPEVGVVTVSERPTRVIVTAMFLLGAGLFPGQGATWALAGAAAWVTVGAAGLVQLSLVVRRRLGPPPSP